MNYFEIECVFGAKVNIRASTAKSAGGLWSRLTGHQIDLLDPRWTDPQFRGQIQFKDRLLFWTPTEPLLTKKAETKIRKSLSSPPDLGLFLMPLTCSPRVKSTHVLNVAIRSKVFVRTKTRSQAVRLVQLLDGDTRRHACLGTDSDYWFTFLGFESEKFPIVVSRYAQVDDFLGYENLPPGTRYPMLDLQIDLRRSKYGVPEDGPVVPQVMSA